MKTERFIRAGNCIDGSGTPSQREVYLTVRDGVITAIGPAADMPQVDAHLVDDYSHCTIVPPLIDCSVSLCRSPSIANERTIFSEPEMLNHKETLFRRHIHDCHDHGVLGVVGNNEDAQMIAHYKKDAPPKKILHIQTPQDLHGVPTGECTEGSSTRGFIKILLSNSIDAGTCQDRSSSVDTLKRMRTKSDRRKIIALANGSDQVEQAIASGCHAIEQGYEMGEENLKKMADRDILWIPSLLRAKNALDGVSSGGSVCCRFSIRYVAPGKPAPGAEARWKKMLATQLNQLRLAKELGVRTAMGTGAGTPGILHGESLVEEIKLFIKAGYSLEEALQCASSNSACFFDFADLGPLIVGRKATFLITRGSPKQLPRKLAYLEGILINGEQPGVRSTHLTKRPE